MQLRTGVHTFDLEWDYDEPLSVHILDTTDSTVLFGAGDESTADDLVDIAREHGVDAVVVEHGDVDHYGGVPALRDALDVPVAVPAGDATFLEDAGIDPDVRLDAGETYRGIETIPAPGHTPDNMAYLYGDVLVAGDTVAGADSMFAAAGDWSGPLAPMTPEYSADDEQARGSIRRLLDYEFDLVLVTHGSNVREDGRRAVETLVADLDAR